MNSHYRRYPAFVAPISPTIEQERNDNNIKRLPTNILSKETERQNRRNKILAITMGSLAALSLVGIIGTLGYVNRDKLSRSLHGLFSNRQQIQSNIKIIETIDPKDIIVESPRSDLEIQDRIDSFKKLGDLSLIGFNRTLDKTENRLIDESGNIYFTPGRLSNELRKDYSNIPSNITSRSESNYLGLQNISQDDKRDLDKFYDDLVSYDQRLSDYNPYRTVIDDYKNISNILSTSPKISYDGSPSENRSLQNQKEHLKRKMFIYDIYKDPSILDDIGYKRFTYSSLINKYNDINKKIIESELTQKDIKSNKNISLKKKRDELNRLLMIYKNYENYPDREITKYKNYIPRNADSYVKNIYIPKDMLEEHLDIV